MVLLIEIQMNREKDYKIENGEKVESGLVMMQFKSTYPMFDDKDSKLFDTKNNKIKTDIGWGHQIRSYVLQPYQMVKDNRTAHEKGNAHAVLFFSI